MTLDHARRLATEIIRQLRPYCTEIDVAGQLAKAEPEITKLEFQLTPKMLPIPGKIDEYERPKDFVKILNRWEIIDGGATKSALVVRKMKLDAPSIREDEVELVFNCKVKI